MPDSYRWKVLAVAAGALFSTQLSRLVISPVIPAIIDSFGVSKGEIGLALTGIGLTAAVAQVPSGLLGEKYGERAIVLISLGFTGIGGLCLALSPSYTEFFVFALVIGIGTGTYFIAATSLLARLFERQGLALGVHSTGAPLAGLIGPIAAAYIAVVHGWRIAIIIAPVAVLTMFAFVFIQVKRTPPIRGEDSLRARISFDEFRALVWQRSVLFTIVLGSVAAFSWTGFITFFPTFLIEYWAFSTQYAGIVFGVTFAISAISIPVVGRFADWINPDTAIAFSLLTTAAGIALFLFAPRWVVPFAGTAILGIGLSWGGALQSRMMNAFDEMNQSTGFGLIRTATILLGSTGSAVSGYLADFYGWRVSFGLIVLLLLASVGLLAGNRVGSWNL